MKDQLQAEKCSRFMKALATGDRLKIVQSLLEGPRSVGEVAELLHQPIPNVSHHLRSLQTAGLVNSRRDGKFIFYSLNPKFYRKSDAAQPSGTLEFGCCRIELGGG